MSELLIQYLIAYNWNLTVGDIRIPVIYIIKIIKVHNEMTYA